jgi:hypothetical protein
MSAAEATLVSHDYAVSRRSYLMLRYSVVGELCWLQNVLDTLHWNTLFCVCIEAKICCRANHSSLMISANTLRMYRIHCVQLFWPAAHSIYDSSPADRRSEYSATISSLSNEHTHM